MSKYLKWCKFCGKKRVCRDRWYDAKNHIFLYICQNCGAEYLKANKDRKIQLKMIKEGKPQFKREREL